MKEFSSDVLFLLFGGSKSDPIGYACLPSLPLLSSSSSPFGFSVGLSS
jgi:hypothetical protein